MWIDSNSYDRTFVDSGGLTTEVTTPAFGGAGNAMVSGINDSGVTIGWYGISGNPTGLGFYNNGSCNVIGGMTYPYCIVGNNVVGMSYSPPDAAVYTLGAGSATSIGTLAGDTGSAAYGVNAAGTTVVGTSWNGSGAYHAFLYSGGVMSQLSSFVSGTDPFSSLAYATAISQNGNYIVGYGTTPSGQTHGFLLTAVPTPEPSVLLLAASGLAGLLAYAWRRRK
jgi:probable HAF family extracellular repeat protein